MFVYLRNVCICSLVVLGALGASPMPTDVKEDSRSFSFSPLSNQEITKAFEAGIEANATHMLVVWDTYDHEDSYDFVVYCFPGESVNDLIKYYTAPGYYRVSKVFAMHLDINEQLKGTQWYPEYP